MASSVALPVGFSMRRVLEDALLHPDTVAYRRTMRALLVLIMLSIGLVAVESSHAVVEQYTPLLHALEGMVAVAFTLEYAANVYVAPSRRRYVFGWAGIIDVLAILPFYVGLFQIGVATVGGLAFLRQLRVLRILRVLKLAKMTVSSQSAANQDDLWLPLAVFVSTLASGWIFDGFFESVTDETLLRARQVSWFTFQSAAWLSGAYLFNRLTHTFLWEGLLARRMGIAIPRLIRDIENTIVYAIALSAIAAVVFHLSLTGVWTAAGALSVVIGLALRNVIADLFTGIALNVERSFRIGDWVEIQHKDTIGKIVEINWRTTHLVTDPGNLVIIPNSRIGEMVLVNYSAPAPHCEQLWTITLDYSVPPERAQRVLLASVLACVDIDGVLAKPAPDARVRGFTPLGVEYCVQYHVDFTRWFVSRARNTVLKSALTHLQNAGIPLPHLRQDVFQTLAPEGAQLGTDPNLESAPDDASEIARRTRLLRRVPLFAPMDANEVRLLAAQTCPRHVPRGMILTTQDEAADSMFVLAEGLLATFMTFPGETEPVRLGYIEPGGAVGENSAIVGQARATTVEAVTDAIVFEISREQIASLVANRPALADYFAPSVPSGSAAAGNPALMAASHPLTGR